MFIDAELKRYRTRDKNEALNGGTGRMADILYMIPDNQREKYLLVISDGQRHAVALTSSVRPATFDETSAVVRSAWVRCTGFIEADAQTMPPALRYYVQRVNGALIWLQLAEVFMQGRGPALHYPAGTVGPPPIKPPSPQKLPPSPQKLQPGPQREPQRQPPLDSSEERNRSAEPNSDSVDLIYSDPSDAVNIGPAIVDTVDTFEVERAPQFQRIDSSTDTSTDVST